MTGKEFVSIAAQSAKVYHDWLWKEEEKNYSDGHKKGHSFIQINSIKPIGNRDIKLRCNKHILYFDGIKFLIKTHTYEKDEIQIKKYDRKNHELYIIVPQKELYDEIVTLSPGEIQIASDMKFLIKRIQEWYEKYKGNLSLPTALPSMSAKIPELSKQPSKEQIDAYVGIANSPFSYIWGAPGTGKTQFVLSRAVLSYCKANQPVLITAPTNNAVEQTMKGVLSVLKEAGISFDKVLRLGVPSAEFYAEYPMVCETKTAEDEKEYLEAQEQEIVKYIRFYQADSWIKKVELLFASATQVVGNRSNEITNLQNEIDKEEKEYKVKEARFASILSEIDRLNKQHDDINAFLQKPRKRITIWLQKKRIDQAQIQRAEIEANLEKIGTKYEQLKQEQERRKNSINNNKIKRRKAEEEINHQFQQLRDIETPSELSKLTDKFMAFIKNLKLAEPYIETIQKAEVALKAIRDIIEDRRKNYESKTQAEVCLELEEIKKRKNNLLLAFSKRLQDCLVVAATVDGYINKLSGDNAFQPVHVFLDEAAYCPLIKSAVLLSMNVPITLLGDHMQLPPVCEMGDELFDDEDYMPVCLWAQSSLYLASVFSQNLKGIKVQYTHDIKSNSIISLPSQPVMKEYDLQHTFRFGEALAKVLSRYVYTEQFYGNPNINTEIMVIDAPKEPEKERNVNYGECEAIKKYMQEHSISTNYAILTPYRNQRQALLSTVFPKGQLDKDEHVFTIHGSQGREWDIVIISVVSTIGHSFLTPRLLNTAVSRAKKQLILACDVSYWSAQTNHIIGGLIAISNTIKRD